ncbi:MAG TPA: hypothetical protein VGO43_15560 [Pyrinomonadaceae bacterium]|jgi:hypothetical protein|nr:hypothetical protein [Pyrinomonadaceae bacterium]
MLASNLRRRIILACLCLALASASAAAQRSVRLHSTPASFQAFYAKFKKAVARRDKAAVASLTAFPFQWGFDAGDEGTWTRMQFIRNFNKIFDGERSLIAQRDPMFYTEGGEFGLTNENDASHFGFSKKGKVYKFTSYIVEP